MGGHRRLSLLWAQTLLPLAAGVGYIYICIERGHVRV